MPSETGRSLKRSLKQEIDRLASQRRRYELALGAADSDRTRDRHRRSVARLDDEITAREEALSAMVSAPDHAIAATHAESPLLAAASGSAAVLSGRYARFEIDGALGLDKSALARLLVVAFAAGFLVVAFAVLVSH